MNMKFYKKLLSSLAIQREPLLKNSEGPFSGTFGEYGDTFLKHLSLFFHTFNNNNNIEFILRMLHMDMFACALHKLKGNIKLI